MYENVIKLSDVDLSQIERVGTAKCPECHKPMRKMGEMKPELYCERCHISAPLFKERRLMAGVVDPALKVIDTERRERF